MKLHRIRLLLPLVILVVQPLVASADIYEWEWVDPGDHLLGRQQSSIPVPDGVGYDATPSVDLRSLDLTMAWLSNYDLHDAIFYFSRLENADLSNSNFRDAQFHYAKLINTNLRSANLRGVNFYNGEVTGADFSGSDIRGASFHIIRNSSFTSAQLYSTASFQMSDLSGIGFGYNDLSGWNLSGQDLRGASLYSSTLIGTDVTDAIIRGANLSRVTINGNGFVAAQLYSTASYQDGDLAGTCFDENDLTGWDFSGQQIVNGTFAYATLQNVDFGQADISGANLYGASLTGADFTGAVVRGAYLSGISVHGRNGIGDLTASQLYSTASYQQRVLTDVHLDYLDLSSWIFAGRILSGAVFKQSNLSGANFSRAKLTGAGFHLAGLSETNFSSADLRNATSLILEPSSSFYTRNTIFPDGIIHGVDFEPGERMRLWDYDSESPLPILVQGGFRSHASGKIRMVIEDDDWGSTITFEPGIDVLLDGTLELFVGVDEDTTLASLIGTTYQLFDWTGVSPVGQFAQILIDDDLVWDTSELYTNGEVTLVSAAAVPEPGAMVLALLAVGFVVGRRRYY